MISIICISCIMIISSIRIITACGWGRAEYFSEALSNISRMGTNLCMSVRALPTQVMAAARIY